MRDSPASRARSSAPASHMSRWQWVSTIDAWEEGIDLPDPRAGPLAEHGRVDRPTILADRVEQLRRRIGDPRVEQERQPPDAFREPIEHTIELGSTIGLLRELPRLHVRHVCVQVTD